MDPSGRSGEMAVFATVVDAGSLSGAAHAMGLTPSAVSRIVARIESRLGVRLLIRTTRTLSLTPEGQAYLRAARRILADLAEAEEGIADQARPRGRVRLAMSMTYGRLRVVPLLADFNERYPGITLDLELSDRVADISAGSADVAIRFGSLAEGSFVARRLGETGRVVVASPSYLERHGVPREPEDLHDHNCLSFGLRRAEPGWPFRRDGVEFNLDVVGSIEANDGETLTQLARDGAGIARVGAYAVDDDLAHGRLIALLEPFNPQDRQPIHLLFLGGSTMPARVRVLVDFLVEKLSGPRDTGSG